MEYLIMYNGQVWYTNWYDKENNYMDSMIVVNLYTGFYTTNGEDWEEVEEDSL